MKKLFTISFLCISVIFGIQIASAQTKQGHPFTAEELTKLQTKNAQRAPSAITASNKTFNMDSIQYWVGTGSKCSAMAIQWKNADNTNAPVMVWGYRWENEEDGTGEKMLRAIAEQDARLYVLVTAGTAYGTTIGGVGYDRNFDGNVGITKGDIKLFPDNGIMHAPSNYDFDGWTPLDADDYWFSGWMKGFLTYMIRSDYTKKFTSSSFGATGRKLADGSWDLWVANPGGMVSDETINSKFIPATPTPNYTQGTFVVNEDWFGHSTGTVNFLSNDGNWTYRVFRKQNPGHELGVTSQFGTIYGGKMFIVSKQAKTGSLLAVTDARTMKVKAEFTKIGDAEGRSFLGVSDTLGYIGTSNGIYLFDIKNLQVGSTIDGSVGNSQIGTMLRVSNRIFAVIQNKGILVIDATTNTVETTIEGKYGSIVMTKDGNVWASTDESNNSGKTLVRINPYSLKIDNFILPAEAAIPNSWYAWTADGFCASNQTNSLYWKESSGWSLSKKIYKFDASNPTADPVVIYENTDGWGMYGAGFRVHPLTDEIYLTMFKGWGDQSYKVIKLNGNGELLNEYPMEPYYWFPAMPVFPDNFAPEINTTELKKFSFKDEFKIYLGDKITDKDNFNAAIVKSFTLSDTDLANVKISGDTLYLAKKEKIGEGKLTLTANSNGKVVSTVIEINVIDVPQIVTQPADQDVVVGEKATFTVEVTGGDLTYQWYRDDAEIKYAKSATYSINSTKLTDNGAKFHCVVKNSLGEVVSEKATLTTKLIKPEITEQPNSYVKATNSGGVTFRVKARGGELTYQWYKDGEAISGATKTSYSITRANLTKDKSGEYHCVVSNSIGSTESEKATLLVLDKVAITTQPEDLTVQTGAKATFTVEATGDSIKFQWFFNDSVKVEGATEASYTIDVVSKEQAGEYHCEVNNAVSSETSSKVTLIVLDKATITTQPEDLTVQTGAKATFTVEATGDSIEFQWFYNDSVKIEGATEASYTIDAVSKEQTGKYHCEVKNAVSSETSSKVTLTVLDKVAIVTQPQDIKVLSGATATFIVEVTGDSIEFQWFKDDVEIDGANEATYTIDAATEDHAGKYHCVVKNAVSNETSNKATLTILGTGMDILNANVKVIPNPATTYVSVDVCGYVAIYSASGTKVYENHDYTAGAAINVSSFTNGIYLVKTESGTCKLVKK